MIPKGNFIFELKNGSGNIKEYDYFGYLILIKI